MQIILKKVNEPKIDLPVLKQAVVRVKHLMRKKVEPLPGYASVVQAFFSLELEHQALSHVFRSQLHNLKNLLISGIMGQSVRSRALFNKT